MDDTRMAQAKPELENEEPASDQGGDDEQDTATLLAANDDGDQTGEGDEDIAVQDELPEEDEDAAIDAEEATIDAEDADMDAEEADIDADMDAEEATIDAEEKGADDDEDEAANYELEPEHIRMAEALLFAASEPLNIATLKDRMPEGVHIPTVLGALQAHYEGRGVELMNIAGKWVFRTAPDLSFMMEKERVEQRRLSRAAIETLAIIAYHQPVTRAEIEAIRGVSVSKGTIDVLLEVSWIKLRGRRRVPGRPVTYGTSDEFLNEFGLDTVKDLPGLEELKAAGLLDARLPPGFGVPVPDDTLLPDEEDDDDDDDQDDLFDGDIATPFDDENFVESVDPAQDPIASPVEDQGEETP